MEGQSVSAPPPPFAERRLKSDTMQLYTIRQHFNRPRCSDIVATVRSEATAALPSTLRPGGRVAIAAGSRGIANIDLIVKALVAAVRDAGAAPFIVPAMGSHGGATADGQTRILAEAGITDATVGAPVISSMEVVELPGDDLGNRVFMDKAAAGADGVILVNRIKPHTDFHGRYESGLVKMAVVGLGKHAAATELHSFGGKRPARSDPPHLQKYPPHREDTLRPCRGGKRL